MTGTDERKKCLKLFLYTYYCFCKIKTPYKLQSGLVLFLTHKLANHLRQLNRSNCPEATQTLLPFLNIEDS